MDTSKQRAAAADRRWQLIDRSANRLARLYKERLRDTSFNTPIKDEAKAIGREIHQEGGKELMRDVRLEFAALMRDRDDADDWLADLWFTIG